MKKLALHWKIIIGLLLGIVWAYVSATFGWSVFTKNWIAPWGEIFINLLKLIAIPLVLFSIIVGISGLSDIKKLGRVGAKTLGIYLVTTVRSEEHTSELQSRENLVCRLLLEKKK